MSSDSTYIVCHHDCWFYSVVDGRSIGSRCTICVMYGNDPDQIERHPMTFDEWKQLTTRTKLTLRRLNQQGNIIIEDIQISSIRTFDELQTRLRTNQRLNAPSSMNRLDGSRQ